MEQPYQRMAVQPKIELPPPVTSNTYPNQTRHPDLRPGITYALTHIVPGNKLEFDPQGLQIRIWFYDYKVSGAWMASAGQPNYDIVHINDTWQFLPAILRQVAAKGATFTIRGQGEQGD